jgi:hypothetical protein
MIAETAAHIEPQTLHHVRSVANRLQNGRKCDKEQEESKENFPHGVIPLLVVNCWRWMAVCPHESSDIKNNRKPKRATKPDDYG